MARSRITPEREAELYEAVLDLLRTAGYEGLTMDAVAARTRSSKATLYRQWGSKPELVARALRHNKPVSIAEIDTGSLRGDFHAMVDRMDDCQMEKDSALMRGLAHAIHENPDLHQALRDLLIDPEMTGLDTLVQRAVDRGELPADNPALKYVPHMLVGAFIARPLIEDRSVDRDFISSYLDAVVLPALGI
ncbi:TetR family transcriptional regulator [Streptomyces lunaelactis]|uniref:TetR family transcriptional regulator n=1 Tax=Streptomyces lunaelactis TaxID=1535768 RepID=A0A2R4T2X6_9ACTN|nr:TetR/AcrR family transcriptional regulator [Streptomyces lunaelactis]AVZ73510.1 TetR family transcriptional regulator [Streptomyces lunaelactis]NUK04235.1 TetR/AcrR family transcriptional regulator [Streptomyces lunaelactis]NUK18341.1 TetR/AcrR family transcriptional regulator [Streptomyces lunaelactis]NUK86378.1 TetR/AcrR family transcriptional regulator [Streptomyces lunaelactis]NUL04421.1 TetR/AcrR family transcriptional regulator [Streptomyces lunaelactis]